MHDVTCYIIDNCAPLRHVIIQPLSYKGDIEVCTFSLCVTKIPI